MRARILLLASCLAIGCGRSSDASKQPSASASATLAAPSMVSAFAAQPAREPDASLRFASPDGAVDAAPLQRPKPWLVEDPNLDALMPTSDADDLEERWYIDDVIPISGPRENSVVFHRVHADFAGGDARVHERDVLARIDAMHLGPNVYVPVATFTDAPGLETISLGPLAPWSGRRIGIAIGTSNALFQIELTTHLSPDHADSVRKFAEQIPGAKLAFDLQKDLHAGLVGVHYQRRRGRIPMAMFEMKAPPNAEEEAKLTAVDAMDDPLSDQAHEKRLEIIGVYMDRWQKKVATVMRAHGLLPVGDGEHWGTGSNVVHFMGDALFVVIGES